MNGQMIINLPAISSLPNQNKRTFIIVDVGGNLSVSNNQCIIQRSQSTTDTISGQDSYTMAQNFSSVQLSSNGSNKWLVL